MLIVDFATEPKAKEESAALAEKEAEENAADLKFKVDMLFPSNFTNPSSSSL